jgi:hypothetical protein
VADHFVALLDCNLKFAQNLFLIGIEAIESQSILFAQYAIQQTVKAAGTTAQHEQAQLWTFEHQLQEAENHRPVLIRVKGPGMVHAGVNRAGKWIRMYDVPLQEVSPGVWEASLLDPEVNEFTFIWYNPNRSGEVHWEGKNYLLPRRPIGRENAEWPMDKSIKDFLDQVERG